MIYLLKNVLLIDEYLHLWACYYNIKVAHIISFT